MPRSRGRRRSTVAARLPGRLAQRAPRGFTFGAGLLAVGSGSLSTAGPAVEPDSLPPRRSCRLADGPRGCRAEAAEGHSPLLEAGLSEAAAAQTEPECRAVAQRRWISCGNAALEPIAYVFEAEAEDSGLKTYPPEEVRSRLQSMEDSPLRAFFDYDISFFWATHELTQYSDIDVSKPSCGSEWLPVRSDAHLLAFAGKGLCDACEVLPRRMWAAVDTIDPAGFPFSGARSDCFLGVLTVVAAEFLCVCACGAVLPVVSADFLDLMTGLWRRLQLEVEALLFFLSMPLMTIVASGWPLPTILRRIGRSLRDTFEVVLPNECDLLDTATAEGFKYRAGKFAAALLEGDNLSLDEARDHIGDARGYVEQHYHGCPFGQGTAFLAMLWAAKLRPSIVARGTDLDYMALDSLKAWDALSADRVGKKRRFFYDILTTRWPWLMFLEAGSRLVALPPMLPAASCTRRVLDAASAWSRHGPAARFNTVGEAPLAGEALAGGEALAAALCALEGSEVLFISGTSSGYKWGSFTVRGRQAARGLRMVRDRGPALRARAFNSDCKDWCHQHRAGGSSWSDPLFVVHIKYPCACAIQLLPPSTRHIYDPVDQFALVPRGMHAILAQTSTAAADYAAHPSVRVAGMHVYWHPLHHSNFHGLVAPVRTPPEVVGVHTTHNDTELYGAIEAMLEQQSPHVRFEHADPAARFSNTGGHVVSPAQTDEVIRQLAALDVTVLRSAGCMAHLNCEATRRWLSSQLV